MTKNIPMTDEQRQEWQDNTQAAAVGVINSMMVQARNKTGSNDVVPIMVGCVSALAEFGVRAGIDQDRMRGLIIDIFNQSWPHMVMCVEANTETSGAKH